MLEIVGHLITGFLRTLWRILWGSIWIIPFSVGGLIGLAGIIAGDTQTVITSILILFPVVMIAGWISAKVTGSM